MLDRGKIRLRFVDLPYQLLLVHEPVMPEDGCLIVRTLMVPIDNRPPSRGGSHRAPYSAMSTSTGTSRSAIVAASSARERGSMHRSRQAKQRPRLSVAPRAQGLVGMRQDGSGLRRALIGRKPGSHETPRWREMDSNSRWRVKPPEDQLLCHFSRCNWGQKGTIRPSLKRGSRDGETSKQFASATEKWGVAGTGFGAGRATGYPRQKAIPHTRLAGLKIRGSGACLPGSAEVRGADRASQIRAKLLRNVRGRGGGAAQAPGLSVSSGVRHRRLRNQLHGADRGMGEEKADR
jgi:hypothetical protein